LANGLVLERADPLSFFADAKNSRWDNHLRATSVLLNQPDRAVLTVTLGATPGHY